MGKTFLASDLVLLVVFISLGIWFHSSGVDMPYAWHISPEFSIPSLILLLKWLTGAVFCLLAFRAGAGAAAAAAATVLSLLLLVDAFSLHDVDLNLFGNSKSMEIVLGLTLLVSLAAGFLKQKQETRSWFFYFSLLLGGLLVCGLIIDQAAEYFRSSTTAAQMVVGRLVSMAEDGGEMIFGSLMAGHAFDLLRAAKK